MKALLIDDEHHEMKAIHRLTNWQELGIHTILEAEDGLQAQVVFEREQPEIILTTLAIILANGHELLSWMKVRAAFSKIIIIQGEHGVERETIADLPAGSGFLPEPIQPNELETALHRAVEQWKQEERLRLQERLGLMDSNPIKPVIRDNLLSLLVNDADEFPFLQAQLYRHFPALSNVTGCRIAILNLDTTERNVRERFVFRRDLLFFSLINICNECMQKNRNGTAFRYMNSDSEIILLLWDQLAEAEAFIGEVSQRIVAKLQTWFDFGIGLEHPFPQGLATGYKEARSALRNRNLLLPGCRITIYGPPDSEAMNPLHLTDYEEHVRISVRSGKPEQIAEALQEFIDAVQKLERITVEQLELWGHEYNVLKARWAKEFFKDEKMELGLPSENAPYIVPMDERGTVSIELWQQELTESLTRLADRLLRRQLQGSSVIFDIAKYIDNHYAGDLTLQELADQFFLSREYISRKFKQQFDENVVDYISRVRVDKSKLLLLNPMLKIAEVAQSVGYQDEKYFSKVFKKLEGVSPNEYRKTMKLLESVESN